jgi:hypothetical protein
MKRRRVVPLLLACASAWAEPALAQAAPPQPTPARPVPTQPGAERAQVLFDAALKMMAHGEYAPACTLLEQSERLDPGMGTRFRLAECFERIGRVASAWRLFLDVAKDARQAQIPDRERVARQRAAVLVPRLARLLIRASPGVASLPGVVVEQDGQPMPLSAWAEPTPLDPGEHAFDVAAPGKKSWHVAILIDMPGKTFALDIPELADAPTVPPPGGALPPPGGALPPSGGAAPPPGGAFWVNRRVAAAAAGAVGVAGLVAAGLFGAAAASAWSDAEAQCEDGRHDRCTADGVASGEEASSLVTLSTISAVVGLAGLGGGLALWLTAPRAAPVQKASFQLAPSIGSRGAFGTLRVTF